ncbi:MAG: aminotransferase class V-fold PLP-dependent enzyme [Oscillospiraceae bacterium]|nr:aminotransferase class V-fold PLP-dependent enzyme [Oscillospiraceae bacterium]
MIYFDSAATTFPKPAEVANSVYRCINEFGGNPGRSGHKMSLNAAKIVYEMRENVADFFGLEDAERVILTKNCTESLNIAIFGIMNGGGNAITSHFEHNSVMRPLEHLKKIKKCNYKVAKVSFESPQITVKAFERLIDSETKMIICTHASNVNGKIAPIKGLSALCKRRGLIFCLDASQSAGIVKIDMEKDGIDILCCPGHKALFGPTGTGLLLVGKRVDLSPFMFGGTGSTSVSLDMPDFYPDMLEGGTVNVVGAAGLSAGISFIKRVGIDEIYNHEMRLSKHFYNKLSNNSHILLYNSSPNKNFAVSTVSFNVKGKTSTAISEELDRYNIAVRGGLHCSPMAHLFMGTRDIGTVRASFSYFNTIKEVDYACRVIEKLKI